MKLICLLLVFVSFVCCQSPQAGEDLTKEVIISGRVLNRDVYPNEKTVTFIIPFFSNKESLVTAPIADDGTFQFRFPPYASVREVAIRNYAGHLYVSPGDSLHVEIDFSDLLHPRITGTSGTMNQYMTLFTEGGYYLKSFPYNRNSAPEEFEKALKEEYASHLERRDDFLKEHAPGREVEKYTADLLKIDYYTALFDFAKIQAAEGKDVSRYIAMLPELNPLFSGETIYGNLFRLAESVHYFIFWEYGKRERKPITPDLLIRMYKDFAFLPYLYLHPVTDYLVLNDTTYLYANRQQFDSVVQLPHLRQPVLELYQSKVDYLKNPDNVSHHLLYGPNADEATARKKMPFMIPLYDLLKNHTGKVIYIDFWGTSCPPCLAEMEPLKELRKQYSPEEVAIISICTKSNRDAYRKVLNRFSLEGKDIECIYQEDWITDADYNLMKKHWEMRSLPQYLLINREGVIVNFGTQLRPSYPQTRVEIDALLE